MSEVLGKVVLITGAASRFGEAVALEFSKRGAQVHLVDINELGLKRVVERLREAGLSVSSEAANCTEAGEVERVVSGVLARRGRIDVLINNISVFQGGRTRGLSHEDWHWIIDSNFWGVAHPVRAVLPFMLEQGERPCCNNSEHSGASWAAANGTLHGRKIRRGGHVRGAER